MLLPVFLAYLTILTNFFHLFKRIRTVLSGKLFSDSLIRTSLRDSLIPAVFFLMDAAGWMRPF